MYYNLVRHKMVYLYVYNHTQYMYITNMSLLPNKIFELLVFFTI